MMIRAALLATGACIGILGAIGLAIASVVFILKKKRNWAGMSAVLALLLGAGGIWSTIQFVTKSFRAVDHFLVEASEQSYDVDTPDTMGNRKGFERHFKMQPGDDVSQVYYYADEFGADVRYQLSFKCKKNTIDQIVSTLSLAQAPPEYNGLAPRDDLKWWRPHSTEERILWVKEKKNEYYRELWYSENDSVAFYHEYSM